KLKHSRTWSVSLSVMLFLTACEAGKQMPKLSNKKLCADSECSHPILIAQALQDYYPGDCRFIPIRQGQLVYVYAMLKDRGNLFWAGSVQNTYYGEQEARIGHFPSSVVEETHALMPATTEVKTTVINFYYLAVIQFFFFLFCFDCVIICKTTNKMFATSWFIDLNFKNCFLIVTNVLGTKQ
uniref:SH3 domain-containing protein n=1 Tax=Xiphophorus couchianus TaxID=32473 RepID=A0A3B5MPQ4_9TELE